MTELDVHYLICSATVSITACFVNSSAICKLCITSGLAVQLVQAACLMSIHDVAHTTACIQNHYRHGHIDNLWVNFR